MATEVARTNHLRCLIKKEGVVVGSFSYPTQRGGRVCIRDAIRFIGAVSELAEGCRTHSGWWASPLASLSAGVWIMAWLIYAYVVRSARSKSRVAAEPATGGIFRLRGE